MTSFLGALQEKGRIRMMRRKLGFGPPELGEFRITISTRDLAQLDAAFERGVPRTGEIESFHTAAL